MQTAFSEDIANVEAEKIETQSERQLALSKFNETGINLKNDLMRQLAESNHTLTVAFVLLTLLIVFVFGGLKDVNCVLFAIGSFFSSIYNLFFGFSK